MREAFLPGGETPSDTPSNVNTSGQDWAKTLSLVHRAADAARAAEQRIRDLETRHEELRQTTDQLNAVRASLADAERRAAQAEKRLQEADDLAEATHEWVVRIQESLGELQARSGKECADPHRL